MKKDTIGSILLFLLFILLIIAGIISYQSIDWDILKKIEKQKLILPTPVISQPISTQSAIQK